MVDNGEMLEQAMIRESVEEVLNLSDSEEVEKGMKWLQRNIPKGIDIYKGYVCDERNTDNAWIETCVRACLETQEDKIDFPFKAGTDADDAFWTKVSHNSTHMHHKDILQSFCDRIGAKF
uniref:Putative nudix hydrolase 6 (Trinotate prediction) n=1 Tax=Henneguya salminicola TaxID=69463 RepID=A0A6G3MHH4_HENSL